MPFLGGKRATPSFSLAVDLLNVSEMTTDGITATVNFRLHGIPFPVRGKISSVAIEYFNEQDALQRLGYAIADVDIDAGKVCSRLAHSKLLASYSGVLKIFGACMCVYVCIGICV